MKGVCQNNQYFNFDATTANSYVYSDKGSGAIWQIERVDGTNSIMEVSASGTLVVPTFTNKTINILSNEPANVKIIDIQGRIMSSYYSNGYISIDLNYPDGLYLIAVSTSQEGMHKVFLKK